MRYIVFVFLFLFVGCGDQVIGYTENQIPCYDVVDTTRGQ